MKTTPSEVTVGKLQLTARPKKGYLEISLAGPAGSSPVGETSNQILDFCRLYQNHKILFDVRGMTGNMSTLERFTMSSVFAGKYLIARCSGTIPPCQFAVIGNPPIVDPGKFEETVAVNRGLPVKTFTNLDQAVQWLDGEA